MSKSIEELVAESEIKDVHIRYCRANDRRDEALMRSCFHPDAVIQLHETLTVDQFIAMGNAVMGQFLVTWHNTGNQLVEVDGELAWAEHYTTSTHRMPADESGPEREYIVFARYNDRMEKRDGVWRIAKRVLIVDYTRNDPLPDGQAGAGHGGSARDFNDPSYSMRLRR